MRHEAIRNDGYRNAPRLGGLRYDAAGRPVNAGRLVELQSPDNNIGIVRPTGPARYEMNLAEDGSAVLRLDCNQARGR